MNSTYLKFELLRSLRNRRFFIFSLAFPILMYYLVAAPNRNDHNFGGDATHRLWIHFIAECPHDARKNAIPITDPRQCGFAIAGFRHIAAYAARANPHAVFRKKRHRGNNDTRRTAIASPQPILFVFDPPVRQERDFDADRGFRDHQR